MDKRTIRELGGEIWGEIFVRRTHGDIKMKSIPFDSVDEIIDLIMGVLARYKGVIIADDEDLPVTPLAPHPSTTEGTESSDS